MVTRGRRCRCAVLRDSRERAREWVASAPTRARSESEAQEDDTRLRKTSRVASPLVMARRRQGGLPRRFRKSTVYGHASHYPCFAGGSATRDVRRPPRLPLRLRCAPPSARSNVIHAKASESGHLKRSFSSPPVASAQTTSRAPNQRISARRDSLAARPTKASEGGGRGEAAPPPVASAQTTSRALKTYPTPESAPADVRARCGSPLRARTASSAHLRSPASKPPVTHPPPSRRYPRLG